MASSSFISSARMLSYSLLVLLIILPFITSSTSYNYLDRIPVYANTVGPLHNNAEVYPYYSLPYCQAKEVVVHSVSIGEAFAGDRKQLSLYDIRFKLNTEWQNAIHRDFMFEIFIDGLHVRGFVGEQITETNRIDGRDVTTTHTYLFPHVEFSVAFNGDKIIAVNATGDPAQRVELIQGNPITIDFSFSTHWWETETIYDNRLELHQKSLLQYESDEEIHWLSIINSFVLVLLLTIFMTFILVRVLRNDLSRYLDVEDIEQSDLKEETGWKMLKGDIFRAPDMLVLFSSCLGTGCQLLTISLCILILQMIGTFYHSSRSALYTAGIAFYALTAYIAGFVSNKFYMQYGGEKWATNAVLTASLFAGPFFVVFSILNSIALYYKSSTAVPMMTVFTIILIWAAVSFPLTVFGAMHSKKNITKADFPCKVNRVEREIPASPLYRNIIFQIFAAGFFPFTAIYIELHYTFSAIWGHHSYNVFGILGLTFVLLLIVVSFVTIALTYIQLSSEDHKWWWKSFIYGGATGFFIFFYGWYFFNHRSYMEGTLQTSFFFGYLIMGAYAFLLMLGSVGHLSTYYFVYYIYNSIKSD